MSTTPVGLDNTQLTVAARTYLYLGDVGAVAPTNVTTAVGSDYKNVGHTTPDSMSFSTEPNFVEVPSAQSDYPVLRFQTSDSATLAVQLLQWSSGNFQAVYGGGTITTVVGTPTQYKFVPPKIGERKEVSAVLETIFGAKRYRFVFPRSMQVQGVQLDLQKGQESRLPLSLSILGGDDLEPWYLLTNDPNFAPTGD